MKFKFKLALTIFLISVVTLLITNIAVAVVSTSSTIEHELEKNEESVQYISETIERYLLDLVRLTETISSSEVIETALIASNSLYDAMSEQDRLDDIDALNTTWMNTDDINDPFIKSRMENDAALYLSGQQDNSPELFGELFLTNKYGLAISTTGQLTSLKHYNKYWWQGAYSEGVGSIFIDDRGFDESVSGYVLGIVIPIFDDSDQIIGMLKTNYRISQIFDDSISFFHQLEEDGDFYIVRTLGLIIDGNLLEPLSEEIDDSILPYLEDNTDISIEHQINNEDFLLSISLIDITFDSELITFGGSYDSIDHSLGNKGETWSVIYIVNEDLILSGYHNVFIIVGIVGVILIFVITAVALLVSGTLSGPISRLNKYIQRVGTGDLTKEDIKPHNDEVGELTASFNIMIDNLSQTLVSKNEYMKSERKFRNLFERAPFGYQSLDETGRFLEVNEKWLEIFGYKKEEIIGTWFGDYLSPQYKVAFKKRFEKFKSEGLIKSEFPMKTKYGTTIQVAFDGRIGYNDENKFNQTHCTVKNVTEMNIMNEKLKYETKLAQKYLNLAGVMILALDSNGNITLMNKKGCEIIGLEEKDILGKNWFDNFIPKDIKKTVKKVFEDVFKNETELASHFENVLINAKGESRLISWYNSILYDSEGKIIGVLSSGEDITDSREKQNRLIESEARLNRSQSIAQVGSWELDIESNKIWASSEAFAIYELEQDSEFIEIQQIQEMVVKENRLMLDKALIELMSENKKYDVIFKILTTAGVKWIHSKAELSFGPDGKPKKVLGVIRDISDIKEHENSLIEISNHDFLTGLHNRRYFVEKYNEMDNSDHYPLGIMMLDVNGLKIVNDALGHGVGDLVLKKVAHILKTSMRKKDIVSRIGGDEFAVILPNVTEGQIEKIKTTIHDKISKATFSNINISLATGYEIKDLEFEGNLDEILKLAENHMYRHKLTEGASIRNNAIKAILKTLTDKYNEEKIHSSKVSNLCKQIGESLNLNVDELKELELAGMYHDIGKISIPDAILNKPGRLTKEEFDTIKTHPEVSYQILRAADEYSDIAIHALHHHERWDGKGYPNGMKGKEIPLFSRIICVADAFEAMTSDRTYKLKLTEEEAVQELIRCSGTQFDEEIAKPFVTKVLKYEWK